jgi:hypothetical protein
MITTSNPAQSIALFALFEPVLLLLLLLPLVGITGTILELSAASTISRRPAAAAAGVTGCVVAADSGI